jgi:hypothetical protein
MHGESTMDCGCDAFPKHGNWGGVGRAPALALQQPQTDENGQVTNPQPHTDQEYKNEKKHEKKELKHNKKADKAARKAEEHENKSAREQEKSAREADKANQEAAKPN